MSDLWSIIRNVAEVLGMVFLPILGWMLMTLINHSKKIIILEERVNKSILSRLESLEKHFENIDEKVDRVCDAVNRNTIFLEQKDRRLEEIMDFMKNLKKSS